METEKDFVGMSNCFFCNKPKGVVLDRRMKKSLERNMVYDKEPCDTCKGYMEQGIIIISVRDGESGDNPYRTGGWWVVKEDLIKRICNNPYIINDVMKKRVVFMPDDACEKIGLKKAKVVENGINQ